MRSQNAPLSHALGPRAFAKYHALGNDYLVIDRETWGENITPASVRALCERHRGVGSDGLLVYVGASAGRHTLEIHNPDGSMAERSGNGLRIFARFLYDFGYDPGPQLDLMTSSGPAQATLRFHENQISAISMQMGRATFGAAAVHLDAASDAEAFPLSVDVDGETVEVFCCSMGNPHAVMLVDELDPVLLRRLGPKLERHPTFAKGTNVQLAHVVSRTRVEILIWERGAHETQASGSSSCAVAAVLRKLGRTDANVLMTMPGGVLEISVDQNDLVTMTGPAVAICRGEILL